jgi:hypothetical protein
VRNDIIFLSELFMTYPVKIYRADRPACGEKTVTLGRYRQVPVPYRGQPTHPAAGELADFLWHPNQYGPEIQAIRRQNERFMRLQANEGHEFTCNQSPLVADITDIDAQPMIRHGITASPW